MGSLFPYPLPTECKSRCSIISPLLLHSSGLWGIHVLVVLFSKKGRAWLTSGGSTFPFGEYGNISWKCFRLLQVTGGNFSRGWSWALAGGLRACEISVFVITPTSLECCGSLGCWNVHETHFLKTWTMDYIQSYVCSKLSYRHWCLDTIFRFTSFKY